MGLPDILYKYRVWSEPNPKSQFQRRLITDNEIYLASANQFNDPFDCATPFKYSDKDMTDENIFRKLYEVALYDPENKGKSNKEIQEICYKRQSSGVFEDKDFWKDSQSDYLENVNRLFGIISLTKKNNNLLMWSHYANSHTGFCVGIDTKILYETIGGMIGNVIYQEDFPEVKMFNEGSDIDNSVRLLNTKSIDWRYEQEVRLIKAQRVREVVKLPDEAIKEIILGTKMSEDDIKEISNLAMKRKINLFQAKPSLYKFELDIHKISLF